MFLAVLRLGCSDMWGPPEWAANPRSLHWRMLDPWTARKSLFKAFLLFSCLRVKIPSQYKTAALKLYCKYKLPFKGLLKM